jgi:hypothetical protein
MAGVVKQGINLAEKSFAAADTLSQLGDNATDAASIFSGIPIVGKIFTMVAGAADRMLVAFNSATASGSSFGGSISQFSAAATTAGMNIQEFGALIGKNGNAMTAFGTTTEGGAANFAKVSKQLRGTSSELYALGFSTQDINQGLASYGALMKAQGMQGKKSNAELAQGAKSYLKEMDLLAKVTGQSRSDIEASRAAMAKDAQFQASMAGLGEGVRNSFMSVTDGLQDTGLKNFAKDIMATGTATTEENQKLMAMMPQSAAMLQKMNQKMQRGEAVSMEERNALNNLMKEEGGKNLKNIKSAGAASADLAGVVNSLNATQGLNKDSLKEATEEQKNAAANTDKFNEKMNKMKEVLNGLSNTFTGILANSGFLDLLIGALGLVADLANAVLVPALKALDAGIRPVIDIFMKAFPPVLAVVAALFEKVGLGMKLIFGPMVEKIGKALEGVSMKFEDFKGVIDVVDKAFNFLFGIVNSVVAGLELAFGGLFEAVQGLMQPFGELWKAVSDLWSTTNELGGGFDWLEQTIIEVGSVVGEAFKILGAVIGEVVGVVTDMYKWFNETVLKSQFVVDMFKTLGTVASEVWQTFRKYFSVEGIKSLFAGVVDGFMGLVDSILVALPLGGISKEVYESREQERKARSEARDTVLVAAKEEKDAKVTAKLAEVDQNKKTIKERSLFSEANKKIAQKELAGREAAAKAAEKSIDFSAGPEELLKQFSGKQGGAVEIGIKKGEITKEKEAADKELAGAKTGTEKKEAAAKIEAAEAKLKALTEAETLAKQRTGTAPPSSTSAPTSSAPTSSAPTSGAPASAPASSAPADAAKKSIEADAEKKKVEEAAAKKKAEEDAAVKAKEDAAAKEKQQQDKKSQESPSTLLAELNTMMAQLIKLQAQTTTNTYETVVATKGLNKNGFK